MKCSSPSSPLLGKKKSNFPLYYASQSSRPPLNPLTHPALTWTSSENFFRTIWQLINIHQLSLTYLCKTLLQVTVSIFMSLRQG